MSNIISLGISNQYYKYILLSTLFLFLNYMTFGINYQNSFVEIKLFPEKRQHFFSKHKYIHFIFCYFFTFLFRIKSFSSIKVIHNNTGTLYFSTNSFLNLLFTIFLWVIMDFFMDFYTNTLKDLDFWFFELLILSDISKKMLKFKLYSHQKLAIYFNSSLCITKMISIILSFNDDENSKYLWYTNASFLKIFFGIFFYFCLISIRSYVNSKIKVYMDLKYISVNKILMLYGFFGTIIYTIICLITSSVECTSSSIFNNKVTNENFVCKVPYNNTINFNNSQFNLTEKDNIFYFDNFDIYFKTFKYSDNIEIFKEIAIILFAGITYFYYKYFCLIIINHLSPIHYIFSNVIFSSIKKIALPIYTLFNVGSFFNSEHIKNITAKYILDISGDFLSLIGFLVFLELIELNFCGFNINLRRKIIDRSEFESNTLLDENFDDDDENGNNKKEEEDNNKN